MEKRFVNFMVMSMLIMTTYVMLSVWMRPDEDKAKLADQAAATDANADSADDEAGDDTQGGETEDSSNGSSSEDQPVESVTPKNKAPDRRVTIGSIAKDSPYRMQVVANTRGATIEAIELSSDTYTDDDDDGAYIGYLALKDVSKSGGCEINIVPAGSPASSAVSSAGGATGLQVDDVIVGLNDKKVTSRKDLAERLSALKPKDKLSVQISRGGTTKTYDVQSRRRPLEVIRPEPFFAEEQHPLSFLWAFDVLNAKSADFDEDELSGMPSLRDENWEVEVTQKNQVQTIEFSFLLNANDLKSFGVDGDLRIVKRYRLAPFSEDKKADRSSGYHLTMDIEVTNDSGEPIEFAYRFDGPTGTPLEGWWYSYKTHPREWGPAGTRDVFWQSAEVGHDMWRNAKILKHRKKNPDNPDLSMLDGEQVRMKHVGVDAQYFAVALLPNLSQDEDSHVYKEAVARVVAEVDEEREKRTDVSYRLVSKKRTLTAGETFKESFTIYAGPKKPKILAQYGLGQVISYGWFPMIAKPLQSVLHFFHNTLGLNYGIAIILLTVLVRGSMYPLSRKQAQNAKKMQELGPEMKKLGVKYKDNMEKRAAAQQELFKKHNCHPLSGCLPSLIQLPIFVGLYKALSVDIELRQAALIPGIKWCSNLAAPDRLWHWESLPLFGINSAIGMLGPYLNILPVFSAVLFLVQQKILMPPPTDEQQEMQQQMMKFMPIMMCFIFWKFPAGLSIYFIASSLWGVAERKLLPKKTDPPAIKPSTDDDDPPPKESIMSKLNPNKPKPAPTGAAKKKARKERDKKARAEQDKRGKRV